MYCFSPLRRLSSASCDLTLYALLGVAPSASSSEIKRAFRQKAKLHHPDVSHTSKDSRHFAKLLVAYQVLSNDRQRQLYDLSLKSPSASVHHAAKQTGNATDQSEGEWVPGAGWFAWATRSPETPAANQIDRLRAELRTEFNAAVRHAYLGPRVQLSTGQLPEAFEGEERTVAGVGDVLQLVSGRQLLGVVRERHDARLPGLAGASDTETLRQLDSGATSSHVPQTPTSPDALPPSDAALHVNKQSSYSSTVHSALPMSPILELVLEGKLVAVAVKKHGKPFHTQQAAPSSRATPDHGKRPHSWQPRDSQMDSSEPVAARMHADPWTCIYAMDGTVLATEQEGNLYKDGVSESHTHTVLTGQTPLVRHMHVVSNMGGQELSICRCRRAWLPPSSTWLFPPRSQDHTTGGWYFEWSGHIFHKHPAWLHPAVFVLLAAFDTLSHEAHAHTPTLHTTIRASKMQQPKSQTQQLKQWVSSMWQFHKQ